MPSDIRLILQESYSDMTRKNIEEWLEGVRARRLSAAITYHQGQAAKLEHEQEQVRRKVENKFKQLENALLQMDRLDDRVSNLLVQIETMDQEYNFLGELAEEKRKA